MPAAAMASVTRTRRPGPARRAVRRIVVSCRYTPSAITSQLTSSLSSRAPAGPGSRGSGGGVVVTHRGDNPGVRGRGDQPEGAGEFGRDRDDLQVACGRRAQLLEGG